MNYGVQKCIWTALGDITANIIQATLVIFVLGSFFVDNPNFLNTFKWVGIAYLLYLAYDIYNSSHFGYFYTGILFFRQSKFFKYF